MTTEPLHAFLGDLARLASSDCVVAPAAVGDGWTFAGSPHVVLAVQCVNGIPAAMDRRLSQWSALQALFQASESAGIVSIAALRDWCSPPAFVGARTCPDCEGLQRILCRDCGGSGTMACPHCEQDMDCDTCDGDGRQACDTCSGTGQATVATEERRCVVRGQHLNRDQLAVALAHLPDGTAQLREMRQPTGLILAGFGWTVWLTAVHGQPAPDTPTFPETA